MLAIKRLIPNLLTAGNLIGGILAIIFTLTGHIERAPYFILLSALFDFLDGFAARLLNVQSELGKQLDSLADMVTFGVAPGMILFVSLDGLYQGTTFNQMVLEKFVELKLSGGQTYQLIGEMLPYCAFLIPVFALFRLAKFNLDTRQSEAFIGLPTPAVTLFFAILPILALEGYYSNLFWKANLAHILISPIFLVSAIIIMSLLMVSEIPLFALKFKNFTFKGNEVRFIFLTISLILLATLFFWAIPIIIILYIILSLINNAIKPKHEV